MKLLSFSACMPALNVSQRALLGRRIRHPVFCHLHTTPVYNTDGVYRDLTDMRVRTPWIEALRRKREDDFDPAKQSGTSITPSNRDLKPKKMSDSSHRVVSTDPFTPPDMTDAIY